MRKLIMIMLCTALVFCFAGLVSADADVQVKKAASPPVIDGKIDDLWKDANEYVIKEFVINNGITGDADVSGKWRLLWDEKNLYILAEVSDDVRLNTAPEGNENNDNVELYINANNDSGTSYTNSTHSLTVTWGKKEVVGWTGAFGPLNTEGMKMETTETENGYIAEASFPWANLNATKIVAGKELGVDVHINDNDEGNTRDHKIATFATEDMSWSNPSLFGSAVLSSEVVGSASSSSASSGEAGSGAVVPSAMPKTGMGGASNSGPNYAAIILAACLLSILTAGSFRQKRREQ